MNIYDKIIAYHEKGNDYRLCLTREEIEEIDNALMQKDLVSEIRELLKEEENVRITNNNN